MRLFRWEIKRRTRDIEPGPEGSKYPEELSSLVRMIVQEEFSDIERRVQAAQTTLNRIERKLNRDIQSGEMSPPVEQPASDPRAALAQLEEGAEVPSDLAKFFV